MGTIMQGANARRIQQQRNTENTRHAKPQQHATHNERRAAHHVQLAVRRRKVDGRAGAVVLRDEVRVRVHDLVQQLHVAEADRRVERDCVRVRVCFVVRASVGDMRARRTHAQSHGERVSEHTAHATAPCRPPQQRQSHALGLNLGFGG